MDAIYLTLIYAMGALITFLLIERTDAWLFDNSFLDVFFILLYPIFIVFCILIAPLIYVLRSVKK
ncbi:MAG: hypothetical protein ACOX60_06235 [Massiliimalia sp.]|jgi:hypothetical protein